MNARFATATRWGVGLTLALGVHAAGASVMLARWSDEADTIVNAPVITIDLAPLPVAPRITPTELPPGPQQAEAPPEPPSEKSVEQIAIKPEPAKNAELSVTPPPRPAEIPKEKKSKSRHASLSSAPSSAERNASRAAAPAPGSRSPNSDALPNWTSQLVARLERFKRYPSAAQARGEGGVAELAFNVDRRGGVHHAQILRSSGSALLDKAALALLARAAPLPPPPPEIRGAQIAIVVPIRYNVR
jgi:periplasmic protein TonB